jgi:hypothetical protein
MLDLRRLMLSTGGSIKAKANQISTLNEAG